VPSRRRAWEVLQELRKILTDLGNREIPPPKEKSFQAEEVLLKRMLRVCLEERSEAIAGLAAADPLFKRLTRGFGLCVRRGSNPQPLAPEAK
jgi:hypothetical protein